MAYGIRLKVWGDRAAFTRPEMKVERVSYDVMTPSAARGIVEAIIWKPAIDWIIDKIYVLNEIKFDNIRRNEVANKIPAGNVRAAMKGGETLLCQYAAEDRQQRASTLLRDVAYIIEAHFEMTDQAGDTDTPEKFYNMFLRRARGGQCFHHPYFGCREFPVQFELVEDDAPSIAIHDSLQGEKDLGWMLLDLDFAANPQAPVPHFFRAIMRDGVLEVPRMGEEGTRR